MDVVWQLPVKVSNLTDHDWIHYRAKFHAFIKNTSVCGKYRQDTDYYETGIDESELMKNHDWACQRCLRRLKRMKGMLEGPAVQQADTTGY